MNWHVKRGLDDLMSFTDYKFTWNFIKDDKATNMLKSLFHFSHRNDDNKIWKFLRKLSRLFVEAFEKGRAGKRYDWRK